MKKLSENDVHSERPSKRSLLMLIKKSVLRWGWLILFVLGMLVLVFVLRSIAK